jgi:aspartyl-tRNA(Asn)/glutamyl-tRNA(Gln) amidotransferase subunit A
MSDILKMTCLELRDAIAAGGIKSSAAVKAYFDCIDAVETKVDAYLSTFKDTALERAAQIDDRIAAGEKPGPLAGVPIAVKDNMTTDFGKTTCASKILANFEAPYNATAVQKLLDAGAVIIGKLNMDEFAMGSSTENSGLKQTRNPWNTDCVPGGSSGGSAAAVAARMCAAALGSDTGGSIRQPAAFCGVVGMKPTYGRVSRYGLVAFGSSLDQIGPLTHDVKDAALMLNVIAGHDSRDSTSVSEELAPRCDCLADIDKPLEGLRIAVVPEYNDGAEAQTAAAIRRAIEQYRSLGAEIVEIQMPHADYAIAAYYLIATAEASSNLARFDGVRYGHRSDNVKSYIDVYNMSREEGFGQEVKRRIMLGTYALSSGYYDAYYLKALKVRNLIRGDYEAAFERADALLMPVSPTAAFKIGEKTDDPLQMYLADIYTISLNLAGLPGISIPCGMDSNGMPIGMQLAAPAFREHKLLRIARMYETASGITNLTPRLYE